MLALYRRTARLRQTLAAVFGTGALLGLALYLPVQFLIASSGLE